MDASTLANLPASLVWFRHELSPSNHDRSGSPLLIKHGVRDMLRQRVYGLALGWEDLNG